jgi:hypothetical protein
MASCHASQSHSLGALQSIHQAQITRTNMVCTAHAGALTSVPLGRASLPQPVRRAESNSLECPFSVHSLSCVCRVAVPPLNPCRLSNDLHSRSAKLPMAPQLAVHRRKIAVVAREQLQRRVARRRRPTEGRAATEAVWLAGVQAMVIWVHQSSACSVQTASLDPSRNGRLTMQRRLAPQ